MTGPSSGDTSKKEYGCNKFNYYIVPYSRMSVQYLCTVTLIVSKVKQFNLCAFVDVKDFLFRNYCKHKYFCLV